MSINKTNLVGITNSAIFEKYIFENFLNKLHFTGSILSNETLENLLQAPSERFQIETR